MSRAGGFDCWRQHPPGAVLGRWGRIAGGAVAQGTGSRSGAGGPEVEVLQDQVVGGT
jgi:hypothetical protein